MIRRPKITPRISTFTLKNAGTMMASFDQMAGIPMLPITELSGGRINCSDTRMAMAYHKEDWVMMMARMGMAYHIDERKRGNRV